LKQIIYISMISDEVYLRLINAAVILW